MKKIILILLVFTSAKSLSAQKIDNIYFNLYTDSLKKGTYNYINVDGKLANGRWMPLTEKDISFSTTYGEFKGNELVLPDSPKVEKLTVKAVLKANPSIWKEVTIWIKKKPDDEHLKTTEEILKDLKKENKKNKNKG